MARRATRARSRRKPEFRVKVDGKPVSVRNLAVGQELTAYVKVSEPVIALEPAVDEPVLLTIRSRNRLRRWPRTQREHAAHREPIADGCGPGRVAAGFRGNADVPADSPRKLRFDLLRVSRDGRRIGGARSRALGPTQGRTSRSVARYRGNYSFALRSVVRR